MTAACRFHLGRLKYLVRDMDDRNLPFAPLGRLVYFPPSTPRHSLTWFFYPFPLMFLFISLSFSAPNVTCGHGGHRPSHLSVHCGKDTYQWTPPEQAFRSPPHYVVSPPSPNHSDNLSWKRQQRPFGMMQYCYALIISCL